ncbi:MAG: D-aminoacylase [Candidatus Moranbacteria bacterium]|nr:D-aminoacylase [Candidatus Moranbacteria bacterium]
MLDVLIKNGTIIDGSGQPMFRGDIGIREGVIAEIGDLHNEHAETEIDATNKYVAPGFIDVNNHSDTYWRIFLDPTLESLLFQGVTTIIGGNCGSSLAPLANHEVIKSIQKYSDMKNVSFNWLSMKDFLSEVEKKKMALNFASLVGHGTLRRGLVGDEVRDISPNEMKTMKKMLAQAMKEGALGFSTGLVYTHAKLASSREIAELAEIVKKYNGVYTTHIRGESNELIRAVEEAIRIAQITGVKLQISHLKAMGKPNWPLMEEALNLIETARSGGIDVHFDVYPYTSTGSVLYILLPDWVTEGGRDMMLSRLKDVDVRKRVIKDMKASENDYSKITISISAMDKSLNHKKITEIAQIQGKSVEDAIIDVLIASNGHVVTMMEVLSEKNVDKAVINPFSMVSSNGSGYNTEHRETGEMVHPRNFGSFPRVLANYVRGRSVVGWEEAIRKMSGLPAEKFNIEKRGIIAKGNFADIVVFDPINIADLATVENPYQYSQGIECVLVNGHLAIKDGQIMQARGGEVIRRKSALFEF